MLGIMHAEDETLGRVRHCFGCHEWWPDDNEFWAAGQAQCRACVAERRERGLARMRAYTRRWRQTRQPALS